MSFKSSDIHNALRKISDFGEVTLESPPDQPKRASVTLVIRVRPSSDDHLNENESSSQIHPTNLAEFFDQEWVKKGTFEMLFIKRAERKSDPWSAHVALPGGKRDPEDTDDRAAGERETLEEVGLDLRSENFLYCGALEQRRVSTGMGKVLLLILCPYVFIYTGRSGPDLKTEPAEIGSAHWVPLSCLLDPEQRTYEKQDISNRLGRRGGIFMRKLLYMSLGKMRFAAIKLAPSESVFSDETTREKLQNKNLLLWGLTLGVITDFLRKLNQK